MINKKWTMSVSTPFGLEEYYMIITQALPYLVGRIYSNKGEMIFENGQIIDNEIFIKSSMEYPISCNVRVEAKITDNSLNGHVFIDEYLKVPVQGSV